MNNGVAAPCSFCLRVAGDEVDGIEKVAVADIVHTERTCVRCQRHFCTKHASPVDQSSSCLECLPLDSIEVHNAPLIGEDGVTHRGRLVQPTGFIYRSLPRAISEMSDAELEAFLIETARQIHETEKIQDYRRIAMAGAKLEKADRNTAELRKLRAIQVALPKAAKVTITGKKGSGSATTTGINLAEFLKFVQQHKVGAVPAAVNSATTPKVEAPPPPPSDPREKEIEDLLDGKQ